MTASAVLWPKIRCIINLIFSFLPWSLGVEEYVEDDSKWEKKKRGETPRAEQTLRLM